MYYYVPLATPESPAVPSIVKAADDIDRHVFDWANYLAGDQIATSTWSVDPAGLVIDSDSHDKLTTIVTLSGGATATTYTLTNRITTADGRAEVRTLEVEVM